MLRWDPFVPNEYYHLFNRGVDKRTIFKSPADYRRFILLMYIANSSEPIRLRGGKGGGKGVRYRF